MILFQYGVNYENFFLFLGQRRDDNVKYFVVLEAAIHRKARIIFPIIYILPIKEVKDLGNPSNWNSSNVTWKGFGLKSLPDFYYGSKFGGSFSSPSRKLPQKFGPSSYPS